MFDALSWPARPRNARVTAALLAAVFFVVLFARRFEQLLHPQVWDEDGRVAADIVASGPLAIVHPLNGYLVVAPKIVSLIALLLPLRHYAMTSTVIAWAFTIGVALAVSMSPSLLRGGAVLALALLLVPSDPEVFGVPLYTLWWASTLVFVATLWKPYAPGIAWRLAFIAIGGLSSPLVVIAVPIAIARAIRYRNRAELLCAVLAAACAAVQVALIVLDHSSGGSVTSIDPSAVLRALPEFIGAYPIGNLVVSDVPWRPVALVLCTILPFVLAAVALVREREQRELVAYLTVLWIACIVLPCLRVNPLALSPNAAGPRYFFFPFTIEAWLLIQLATNTRVTAVRACAASLLVLGGLNALPVLSRTHDDLAWYDNIERCTQVADATIYAVPIQFAGSAAKTWTIQLTGAQCRQMDRYGLVGLALQRSSQGGDGP